MIRSVQLIDFLSHSNNKIEFDDGVTVFIGQNGAGKSCIIDAITFALFGEHSRKNNKGLVRRGAYQALASIEFSVNEKNFKAVRTINTKGSLSARFYEIKQQKEILIAEGERNKVGDTMTNAVESRLGLSFEKIKIASIVQQGELEYIIKAQPKQFKELLNSVIMIDKLDLALESIKETQKKFRQFIQEKFGYDDTQIDFIRKKIITLEKEVKESKPQLEKLELEKKQQEQSILHIQKQIEKDATKELQIEELEDKKGELRTYLINTIKQIERENSGKKQKVSDCEDCFKFVKLKKSAELKIQNIDSKLKQAKEKFDKLRKDLIILNEQQSLAKKLVLKDGKCPVCNSKVKHLNPLFQKEHIEQELVSIQKEVSLLNGNQPTLEQQKEDLQKTFEKAKEAEVVLKTHNIQDRNQLQQIQKEIEHSDEQIHEIQMNVNSDSIAKLALIDSHAKLIFDKIVKLQKLTKGFNKEDFFKQKNILEKNRNGLRQIDEEVGALKQKLNFAKQGLTELTTTVNELEIVKEYVTQLEQIKNIVYNRDGPVAMSLRSWALDTISQRASQYIEMLNTKIDRIKLAEKSRAVNIICKKGSTTFDIDSLSGGERVSIAIALRLGIAHLLGSSKLNFMILDEPTAHLDSEHRKELVKVLSQISNLKNLESKIPLQLIIITHDSEIFQNSVVENIYEFKATNEGTKIELLNRN